MANLSAVDLSLLLLACFLFYKLVRSLSTRSSKTTPLLGPARESFIFGASKFLREAPDASVFYEKWASQYGSVYNVPAPFGSSKTMLHDPKAITHFYAREGFGYNKTKLSRDFIETLFGRGVLWAEGELHRRQRKALTPAFSNAAIRNLTSVFYDTAYKMTLKWNAILEGSADGSQVIEVQKWMNKVSMDSIGIAGFSHDFSALEDVPTVFDSMDFSSGAVAFGLFIIFASQFPIVRKLPNQRMTMMKGFKSQLTKVADDLLKKGKEGGLAEDKSIIGMLLRTESDDSSFHMSRDEIIAQMNVLLLAGYETTSISLTWCLIELCRQTKLQDRLREELSQFSTSDPTYEQLNTGLPYLDAVVHETLRTHPPVEESPRVAAEDDFIPLSSPMKTKTGEIVTSLFIAKGSVVSTPIRALNLSEDVWGPDARVFNPGRWLADDAQSKNVIQGHRHLLTFIDGPRTCLGKQFAITEFKAVLSVLIRNYRFEFDGGKTDMELGKFPSLLPRPKEINAEGAYVPLKVTHV